MLSLREAAAQLGCDVRTLARWMHQAGIMAAPCTHDARRHELTAEQVQRLRVHRDSLQVAAAAPLDAGDLAELRALVVDLGRRVERLERAARMPPPSRTERPQGAEDAHTPISVPQPVRIAPERVTGASGLPPGLVGLQDWGRQHGMAAETMRKAIEAGRLPVVHGRWVVGSAVVELALDGDGQAAAARLWRSKRLAAGTWRDCTSCPHDLDAAAVVTIGAGVEVGK